MDANDNYLSTVSHEIHVSNSWVPFQISSIAPTDTAYVNAIAWVSDCSSCSLYVDNLSLTASTNDAQLNDYLQVTGVDQLHQMGIDGSGVTVAVLDSGVNSNAVRKFVQAALGLNPNLNVLDGDNNGHGTFMAGLIGGGATDSLGNPVSIAPGADIVSVPGARWVRHGHHFQRHRRSGLDSEQQRRLQHSRGEHVFVWCRNRRLLEQPNQPGR
jgi:hypothetical protein